MTVFIVLSRFSPIMILRCSSSLLLLWLPQANTNLQLFYLLKSLKTMFKHVLIYRSSSHLFVFTSFGGVHAAIRRVRPHNLQLWRTTVLPSSSCVMFRENEVGFRLFKAVITTPPPLHFCAVTDEDCAEPLDMRPDTCLKYTHKHSLKQYSAQPAYSH